MTLGQTIKELRVERALTQNELCEKIHVGKSTLSQWECDLHAPNLRAMKRLAETLEVDVKTFTQFKK